jgi:hypothetical protein
VRLGQFVTASLGQTAMNDTTSGGGLILEAMEAVSNGTKYPEFKGNVATVYTHPLEHSPGSSGGHYGDDAFTYMNVGEAMGKAMVRTVCLLTTSRHWSRGPYTLPRPSLSVNRLAGRVDHTRGPDIHAHTHIFLSYSRMLGASR